MNENIAPAGGAFILKSAIPAPIFTPAGFTADARLMADSVEEFIRREVLPAQARIEAQEEDLMPHLLQQAGALGLLGTGAPEQYGGLGLPKSTLALLAEATAKNLPFAISAGVHAGVGILPLLCFGTPAQKERYLPALASGEMIGAFALSEADSGSDALSARTKAVLSGDGKRYILNGAKMWITNGGFADLFTVFAKVDGEKFTAFLVERDTPGLVIGREEHKMGLHGSSTRRILLENAQVPVEHLLGEIGRGHLPALCALNLGRLTIGAISLGAAKEWLRTAARYALQRMQFGQQIARFGLIQHKLAEMAVRLFALESLIYRTAGYLDTRFAEIDDSAVDAGELYRATSEEYAIECAIAKFCGTEAMGYVADEGLQIHGGFGYSEEFPMARAYRDARVFRIFEGTNEINRLTVVEQLLRRIERGRLPKEALSGTAATLSELSSQQAAPTAGVTLLADQVQRIRAVTLYCLGQACSELQERLSERQEIMAALADMAASLYALESAWLRCSQSGSAEAEQNLSLNAAQVFAAEAFDQAKQSARYVLSAANSGDALLRHLKAVDAALDTLPQDTFTLRRAIAARVLEREGYCW